VLAASEKPDILAKQFGELGSAASVPEAIEVGDAIIFAVWFDVMKDLIGQHQARLPGKVVVDPSNPIAMDEKGDFSRTLPDRVSAGSVISGMLPSTAHYVKAFGTLSTKSLRKAANRTPQKAVLFYATDDRRAQEAVERLILACGFRPRPSRCRGWCHSDRDVRGAYRQTRIGAHGSLPR
jgi:8-hydroxy-5-deazaflavin:NADPH oxidoreductase